MINIVNLKPIVEMSDEQFYQLCRKNPDVKFERNVKGELLIMPPTGGETGKINSEINAEFVFWNRQKKLGVVFDSSTCFKLPNVANRSPDVAWIELERWSGLTAQEKEKFPCISPDFILELMSPSDSLKDTQDKMIEYINNGVRLGWLINRQAREVEIYRQGQEKEVLINPELLSGEQVLQDFIFNLKLIWE